MPASACGSPRRPGQVAAVVAYTERGVVTANASYHAGSLARPVPVVSYAQWQSRQIRERYCSHGMRFMGPQVNLNQPQSC